MVRPADPSAASDIGLPKSAKLLHDQDDAVHMGDPLPSLSVNALSKRGVYGFLDRIPFAFSQKTQTDSSAKST